MKKLKDIIQERLRITKDTGNHNYNYHPKTKEELKELVNKLIKERGNDADLNDIDTSEIIDMTSLFYKSDFNGDISEWNVSNVKDISYMFCQSKLTCENGDLSNWDVSNVENMRYMFCDSKFDGDISNWNVRNVKNMGYMFYNSKFTGKNGDISTWDVSNVKDMSCMFRNSKFSGDISKWNVSNVKSMRYMFVGTSLEKNPPKWYKE